MIAGYAAIIFIKSNHWIELIQSFRLDDEDVRVMINTFIEVNLKDFCCVMADA